MGLFSGERDQNPDIIRSMEELLQRYDVSGVIRVPPKLARLGGADFFYLDPNELVGHKFRGKSVDFTKTFMLPRGQWKVLGLQELERAAWLNLKGEKVSGSGVPVFVVQNMNYAGHLAAFLNF